MIRTSLFTFFCLLFSIITTTQAQDIKITQFDFATSIEDRQPVDVDTTFAADVGTIYSYTEIEGITDSTEITHVWYHREEEKARINLTVSSSPWRTWSSKSILESWTGPWRVMILDSEENVLDAKTFTISDDQ